jgi:hypothetical protein
MTYTFARVGGVVAAERRGSLPAKKALVAALSPQPGGISRRLHCGSGRDRKGPLFRAASRKTKELADEPKLRVDVWRMIRSRSSWRRHWDGDRPPHLPRHGDIQSSRTDSHRASAETKLAAEEIPILRDLRLRLFDGVRTVDNHPPITPLES